MRIYITSLLLWFIITGCANHSYVKPHTQLTISSKDRVGYIIESGDGILVNNNVHVEREYKLHWSPKHDAQMILQKNIKVTWVNLIHHNFNIKTLMTLFKKQNGRYVLNNRHLYDFLVNKLHLKAIVVLRDEAELLQHGEMFYVDKPSLVSLTAFGLKRYHVISSYHYYLFNLISPAVYHIESEHNTLIYNSIYSSYAKQSGFKEPNNIEEITEEEFLPVRKTFVNMFIQATHRLSNYFKIQ